MSAVPDSRFPTSPAFAEGSVWVDRAGTRRLVGRNRRGVEIPIGEGDGEITPGELLKLALIGCAGMSADFTIGRRLGEDFPMRIYAHGTSSEQDNRYERIDEEMQLDLSGLAPEQVERVERAIGKAIEARCTVERTLTADPEVRHQIVDTPADEVDAPEGPSA